MERRCLIIDPSTMVRRVAARIIRELGLETLEAKTSQEALDLCSDRMPDAIMLDWSLSDRQAGQFLQELAEIVRRQNVARPTILFCSGERQVSRIVEALKAGADEYIMKPFDSDIIRSKFILAGLIEDTPGCAAA